MPQKRRMARLPYDSPQSIDLKEENRPTSR
jgi:hypothetical protein